MPSGPADEAEFATLTEVFSDSHVRKPLIAAVEAHAYRGGFEITLARDLVVAGRTVRFALLETGRGVVATSTALFRALRALPLHVATQLLVTGGSLDAERGHQLGPVNRVSESGEALEDAVALNETLLLSAPMTVRANLAAIAEQYELEEASGRETTARALAVMADSVRLQGGVSALLEKREPHWSGR